MNEFNNNDLLRAYTKAVIRSHKSSVCEEKRLEKEKQELRLAVIDRMDNDNKFNRFSK